MTDILDFILKSERARRGGSDPASSAELQRLEQEVAEVRKAAPEKTAPNDGFRYRIVSNAEQLAAMVADLDKYNLLTVDVETTGLNVFTDALVGVGISGSSDHAFYIPVGHETPGAQLDLVVALPVLQQLFAGKKINAHNAVFEYQVFKRHGITLDIAFDTMISYQLTDEIGPAGLKAVAQKILDVADWGLDLEERPANKRSIREVGIYCCRDVIYTHALYEKLEPIMRTEYPFVSFEVELPLVPVMGEMMLAGVPVDTAYLDELKVKVEVRLQELTGEIHAAVGHEFNINSSQQLGNVLYGEMKVPVTSETKTGKPSTNAETLEKIDATKFPVVALVLEYKGYEKIRSAYLEPDINPETGRVHNSYRQIGAETGRMTGSGGFHAMTMPRDGSHPFSLRKAIRRKGYRVISADYNAQEPKLGGSYSADENMKAIFAAGINLHSYVAKMIFSLDEDVRSITKKTHPREYNAAKAIGLGLTYGKGAYSLAREFTDLFGRNVSEEEAQQFIDRFFAEFPGMKPWLDGVITRVRRDGFVDDMAGRRRRLPILKEKCRRGNKELFGKQRAAEREAMNFVIQGAAASQTKRAMVRCYRRLAESHPLVQIIAFRHDEIVLLAPEDEVDEVCAVIKDAMEDDPELTARGMVVRPEVEISHGATWSAADQTKWEPTPPVARAVPAAKKKSASSAKKKPAAKAARKRKTS